MFRCVSCPMSYCFDCWPVEQEMTRLVPPKRLVREFDRHGYDVPKSAIFFNCKDCKKKYRGGYYPIEEDNKPAVGATSVVSLVGATSVVAKSLAGSSSKSSSSKLSLSSAAAGAGSPRPRDKVTEQLHPITGKVLRTYPKISDAAKFMGICDSGISACCNGRADAANGFCWRFYVGPPITWNAAFDARQMSLKKLQAIQQQRLKPIKSVTKQSRPSSSSSSSSSSSASSSWEVCPVCSRQYVDAAALVVHYQATHENTSGTLFHGASTSHGQAGAVNGLDGGGNMIDLTADSTDETAVDDTDVDEDEDDDAVPTDVDETDVDDEALSRRDQVDHDNKKKNKSTMEVDDSNSGVVMALKVSSSSSSPPQDMDMFVDHAFAVSSGTSSTINSTRSSSSSNGSRERVRSSKSNERDELRNDPVDSEMIMDFEDEGTGRTQDPPFARQHGLKFQPLSLKKRVTAVKSDDMGSGDRSKRSTSSTLTTTAIVTEIRPQIGEHYYFEGRRGPGFTGEILVVTHCL